MKSIEQSTKKVPSENIVKAYLIGLGDGLLEFVDDTIKFHTQKGHIRKKLELSNNKIQKIEGLGKYQYLKLRQ